MPKSFSLTNFQGPIDLLILLVQRDEVQLREIALHLLTGQLLDFCKEEAELNSKADQLAELSYLLALKSRKLLPNSEAIEEEYLLEGEKRIAMIEQLLEHCQFRDIARALAEKEAEAKAYFTRSLPKEEMEPKGLGLDEISLHHLKSLFEKVYKAAKPKEEMTLIGHKWEIREKVMLLLELVSRHKELSFATLFTNSSCREELIVTFLALLELIKQEKIIARFEDDELKFTKGI